MTKKPRDPMHFTREALRLMRKSPLMQFLRGETPEPPSEPPAAPVAQKPAQKRHRGPGAVHDRALIAQLHAENPDWPIKKLRAAYKDKPGTEVKDTWVRTWMKGPRS
jgi:hypothetical protein